MMRGYNENDRTLAWDVVRSAWADLSEEDRHDHFPEEESAFIDKIGRHWEGIIIFIRHDGR
jgi:hypothetical protein